MMTLIVLDTSYYSFSSREYLRKNRLVLKMLLEPMLNGGFGSFSKIEVGKLRPLSMQMVWLFAGLDSWAVGCLFGDFISMLSHA